MCLDPASMAAASNVLQVVGLVTTAVGSHQQAKAQANMYEYQAKVNDQNAKYAQAQAEDASDRGWQTERELRRKADAAQSTQKSLLAAQGTDIGSGSPLDILSDTAYHREQDAAVIRYNAQLEKYGYQTQQSNYIAQANQNRAAASNTRSAGRWNTASSLLTGAATVGNQFAQYQKNYPNRGLFQIG